VILTEADRGRLLEAADKPSRDMHTEAERHVATMKVTLSIDHRLEFIMKAALLSNEIAIRAAKGE
jgi:hypothetical protein